MVRFEIDTRPHHSSTRVSQLYCCQDIVAKIRVGGYRARAGILALRSLEAHAGTLGTLSFGATRPALRGKPRRPSLYYGGATCHTPDKGHASSGHETSDRHFDSRGPRNPTQTSQMPLARNQSDNAPVIGQKTPILEAFTSHRLAQAILMAFGNEVRYSSADIVAIRALLPKVNAAPGDS